MEHLGPERPFRFEDKTSEVARVIELPDEPGFVRFKQALRAFLALLGRLAASARR